MDLTEKYNEIKEMFFDNTLLEISYKIDELYDKISGEEKEIFLRWLELQFIANRLIIYGNQMSGMHKFSDPTDAMAMVNEQKQKIVYLQDWIKEKKSSSQKAKSVPEKISNSSNKVELNIKDYKSESWFKVGVLIASGNLEKLIVEYKSATQVAKHLGIEKSRPYISDSKYHIKSNGSQSVDRNTNIYNDSTKLKKIYNHCIENEIVMTDGFKEIYSKIELE